MSRYLHRLLSFRVHTFTYTYINNYTHIHAHVCILKKIINLISIVGLTRTALLRGIKKAQGKLSIDIHTNIFKMHSYLLSMQTYRNSVQQEYVIYIICECEPTCKYVLLYKYIYIIMCAYHYNAFYLQSHTHRRQTKTYCSQIKR